jgi:alpha-1,2-mannosyltransferase
MGGFTKALRDGEWLTAERARLWAIALLLASLAAVLYILTAEGLNDYQGRPIGTDFSNVYAAGSYVLEGRPEAPFDSPTQHAREREIFGVATPFYGWHYPPFFLFVAALLAVLPYLPALALWQGATLAFYLLCIRAIVGREKSNLWLLLAIAYPAVFINLGHGHNGFLTAALMGFALVLLDRRPVVAGILFGLLAYKPQFGLLIPLVLIATERWKTFAAAAATVGMLALAATLAFGPQVWPAFFASMAFTREVVLEAGNTGWHRIQTVFSWVRMWGGPIPLAYTVQILVTLALSIGVVWLWRSGTSMAIKASGLIIASLLATPYSLDYDLMALAPAIAFWASEGISRGFRSWEKTTLAAMWIVPLVARSFAEATLIPLTAPLLLAAFVLLLRRAAEVTSTRTLWLFSRAR